MSAWRGLDEMVSALVRTEHEISTAAEAMVRNSSQAVYDAVLAAAPDSGGGRVKKGVRKRVKQHGTNTVGLIYLTGTPANVYEKGRRNPYPIIAKPGRATKKRKGAGALAGPGWAHPVKSLTHPGIRPHPFFDGAVQHAQGAIDDEMDRANLRLHQQIARK